nr:reverse transcriptase domain-containing protein [Tanacetum cinerariifolium]
MQVNLEANDLWEMIRPNEKTYADNKKDKTAIAFLFQALLEEQLLQITKHKTAKAIWDACKTRHIGEERVQQARLLTLKSNFKMLHMKEDETIDTFTTKLTTLVNKAASLGHTMEDGILVRKLLNAVPESGLISLPRLSLVLLFLRLPPKTERGFLGSAINDSMNAEAPSKRKGNYPKKEQDRSAGMYIGLQTKRDSPDSQTNSRRKIHGGNKPRISRANNNDFKDLNKACPKDGYPLPKIDWKVESLCGFPFKCFLDAYKSYHQIQMAKEDEEKIAFITSQGIFCYTKMPFSLRIAGETYSHLVDKAFHKQISRNLKVYMDDLVIKSRTEDEIVRDIDKTFKTLREINMKLNPKKYTFEGDFHWPTKAKEAFKQMNQLTAELLMLTAPMEREELIVYLAVAKKTVSAVLMTEREAKQMPIYFVSRELRGGELNYTPMEKLVLALVHTSSGSCQPPLQHTFRSLDWLLNVNLYSPRERANRSLGEGIKARLDTRSKNQMEELLYVLRAHRTMTKSSNRDTPFSLTYEIEAVIPVEIGMPTLRTAEMDLVQNNESLEINLALLEEKREEAAIREAGRPLQANHVLREIHEGSCSRHARTRFVMAKSLRTGYYWPTMHKDARTFIRACQDCQVHKPVPKNLPQNLTSITSLFPFYKWGIDIAGPFPKGPRKFKFLIVAIDYFTKWIEAKPITTISERANRSLGEGIKARLDTKSKNQMEELLYVLRAHRTMTKSSNRDTPFSLTYEIEAVIPVEIGMPTLRTAEMDLVQNNESLEINLTLLEEKREEAVIREAGSKE